MFRRRSAHIGIALALVFLAVSPVVSSCGESSQQKALRVGLYSLNAARDGFVAWDQNRQAAIVAQAKTREEAVTNLTAFRARRDGVADGFMVAYAALALAAVSPTVANLGEAATQAARLYEAIKHLREDLGS